MDGPKCKKCGHSHWSGQPCKFAETTKAIESQRGLPRDLPLVPAPAMEGVTAGETAPSFDRVAYMREYMRKRRAKLKEEGLKA